MTTNEQNVESPMVSRREVIRVGLAAASLLDLWSCQSTKGSQADLVKAHRNLRSTLDHMTEDELREARLASIARRIENRSMELVEEHDEFRDMFDALVRDRGTTQMQLKELISAFGRRRTEQRNGLLQVQDELRAELTPEEWTEAVEVLTQTKRALVRPPIIEG